LTNYKDITYLTVLLLFYEIDIVN